jgi:Rho termination factor, N-terminal domain
MKHYNPFTSAFRAAFNELTSDQACRYYSVRAQQDIQTTLFFIFELAFMTYELGQLCRQWMDVEQPTNKQPEECSAIALNNANPSTLFLTKIEPVTVLSVSTAQRKALPSNQPIGLLPEAKEPITTRAIESTSRLAMGIRELRRIAKERRIKGYSKMSKATLISLLAT